MNFENVSYYYNDVKHYVFVSVGLLLSISDTLSNPPYEIGVLLVNDWKSSFWNNFHLLQQYEKILTAKTSIKPYNGLKKVLVFVFLTMCDAIVVSQIIWFTWNLAQMFMSGCKIRCIVFDVHSQHQWSSYIKEMA